MFDLGAKPIAKGSHFRYKTFNPSIISLFITLDFELMFKCRCSNTSNSDQYLYKTVKVKSYLYYTWGHPIQVDIRRSNVLLLCRIPLEFYNTDYSYSDSRLQTSLEDKLIEKYFIYKDRA